jgi:hypothetical protein
MIGSSGSIGASATVANHSVCAAWSTIPSVSTNSSSLNFAAQHKMTADQDTSATAVHAAPLEQLRTLQVAAASIRAKVAGDPALLDDDLNATSAFAAACTRWMSPLPMDPQRCS